MQKPFMRPAFVAAAVVAAAGVLAVGLALRPAIAGPGGVDPNTVKTCSKSTPCQTYINSGLGAGLKATNSKNSSGTAGLLGIAGKFGDGVAGSAGTSGNGVSGSGGNTGVDGTGGTWGVYGYSASSDGIGVQGQGVNNDGVVGFSSCCNGMSTASSSGFGLYALSESGHAAIYSLGSTGDTIDAYANTNGGVAFRAVNSGSDGADGDGADIEGSYIGVIARNVAGQNYPFVAVDTNGTDLVYIDSAGNLFYRGSLNNFAKTRGGDIATSFTPTSASPTIEDNGTARLVVGAATVQLDSAFAHAIDLREAYQVMLTPDGDTKGLYIASKGPASFVVREVQGGQSTLAFDYHIYATRLGQVGRRMTEMSPSQAAAMMPYAPYIHRAVPKRPTFALRQPH